MKSQISIRKALSNPQLLGHLTGESWAPWRTILIAAMGEALSEDERATFTRLTGRAVEPLSRCEELVAVVGRRGGKTRAMATLAVYLAALCDHRDVLSEGETGVMLLLAQSQSTATVALNYATAIFEKLTYPQATD